GLRPGFNPIEWALGQSWPFQPPHYTPCANGLQACEVSAKSTTYWSSSILTRLSVVVVVVVILGKRGCR
ncbi:MAG: hypothetical protein ACI8QC_003897, partial [Planctomycetota bacterium]